MESPTVPVMKSWVFKQPYGLIFLSVFLFFFLSQACNAPKVHFSMLIFCFYDIRLSKSGSWKGVKCFNAENVI